ncbi:MAG: VOC family protein, partial [Mycobacterium sp.]|nr:VOC family protein [Dietzia sp.]MDZ4265630.1 VOC family protein [Mycobacterium sp.]
MAVKLDLLTPGIEVGLVTTDLDAMVAFYEDFLELEPQGDIEFDGGSQRRYSLGASVLKLVTYTPPP